MKKNSNILAKKLRKCLLTLVCVMCGVVALAGCSGNKKAKKEADNQKDVALKEQETLNQSYMQICTVNDVSYFANGNEEILELSGYYSLDKYIFHNVLSGQTSGDEKQWFIMDTDGNYKVEPGTYEYIKRLSDSFFSVEKDGLYGVVNYKGEVVLPVEYDSVYFYEDDEEDDIQYTFLTGEKGEQCDLYNCYGKKVCESQNEIGKYDVTVYPPYTEDSFWTIYNRVDDTLYNLDTCEQILKVEDGGRYLRHIYLYDGSAIIYDAQFKVKETIKDFDTSLLEDTYKDYVRLGQSYVLNDKYELVDYEEMVAADEAAKDKNTHTLANGDVYKSDIDEDAKLVYIYDESGKEICSYSYKGYTNCNSVAAYGNYIAIYYGDYVIIDPATGEISINGMEYVSANDYNDLTLVSDGTGSGSTTYVLCHGGKQIELKNTQDTYMNENGFWVNDRTNNNCVQYSLDGEVITEIDNVVQLYQLEDDYMLAGVGEGTSVIFNGRTGEITFEQVPVTTTNLSAAKYIPLSIYDMSVAVIAFDDGIYDMSGKKLVDFKTE